MKAPIIALIFSVMCFAPSFSQASGENGCSDSLKTTSLTGEVTIEDEFVLDLEEPFWFQEKVYIHVYDANEKPIVDGAFSSTDLKENKDLKAVLRKSTRYLTLGNHHYYFYEG